MKSVYRVASFQALQKTGFVGGIPSSRQAPRSPAIRRTAVWPSLDAEKIRLATIYAEAGPLRGRPRASPDLTTMMARNGGNNEGWTSHDQRGSTG